MNINSPFDATSIIDTLNDMKNAADTIGSNAYNIEIDGLDTYSILKTWRLSNYFHANDRATTALLEYMRSTLNTQHYGEENQLISKLLAHLLHLINASTLLLDNLNSHYGQYVDWDTEIIGHARPDEQALTLINNHLPTLEHTAQKILLTSQTVTDHTPDNNQWKQHPYNKAHPFKTPADIITNDEKEKNA